MSEQAEQEQTPLSWARRFDAWMFDTASNAGTWIVTLSPAIVFGYSFAQATLERLGWVAYVAGFASGVALEIAGAIAFHVAVALWSLDMRFKAALAATLCAAYVALGIWGVRSLDADNAFQVVGTIVFSLAPIVYASRALARDLDRVAEDAIEGKEREERERQRADDLATLQRRELVEDEERHRQWKVADDERQHQRKQEDLARKRAERRAANERQPSGNDGNENGNVAIELPDFPRDLPSFRSLVAAGEIDAETLTGKAIADAVGVSERTGRNWLKAARGGTNGNGGVK